MANGSLTNPFGLIDERVLNAVRTNERIADSRLRANQATGVNFASREAGNLIGMMIGKGLRKAGVLKDPEMERAQAVSSAQKRAAQVVESTPEELKSNDPYQASIFQHEQLAEELRAAGLFAEASTVTQKILNLKEQDLKMRKLEGEVDAQAVETDIREETRDDVVAQARTKTLQEGLQYQFDLSTHNTRVIKTQAELEDLVSTMGHERRMRPFLESKAASDAQVAKVEAKLGGSAPTLLRLQARRDGLLQHLAMNPDDKWAQENLEDINKAIQTDVLGIQRNIDNYDVTNSVLSSVQSDMIALAGFQTQIGDLSSKLESTTDEPFGKVADTRAAIASGINTVLPLVGMPPGLTGGMAEFIMSDDEVNLRSDARQLRADLVEWLSGNSRSTSVDVSTAEDLTQAMEDATDRRTVSIALTNLTDWLIKKQLLLDSTLLQGLSAVSPSQEDTEESATNDLFSDLNAIGGEQN
jgi:hypothetical protein